MNNTLTQQERLGLYVGALLVIYVFLKAAVHQQLLMSKLVDFPMLNMFMQIRDIKKRFLFGFLYEARGWTVA